MREYTEKTAIRNLQKYLRQLEYEEGKASVPLDGIFDSATEEALVAFQIKNGLEATGIADRETWDALYESYLRSLRSFSPPMEFSPFPRVPDGYELSIGDVSFAVSAVQFLLNEISAIFDGLSPITESGRFDSDTEKNIRIFQEGIGLDVTGRVDKSTWDRLVQIYNGYGKDYVQ